MSLFNHLSVSAAAVLAASMLLWAFIILATQQQRALVAAAAVEATELRWPAESIPKNCELGDESRMGKETEQVEPLGRLVKLGTLFDPVAVEALNTKFTIHTRAGPSELMSFIANGFVFSDLSSERFHFNLTRMAISGFDARRPRTVILISGFMTGDTVNWMERVKDQWLALEDCNVIVVTWKDGNRLPYEKAAATTPRVARQIAIFLHYLFAMQAAESGLCGTSSGTVCGELCSRLHFIGHSLGAHIGGFLGQDFRGQLGRITALDPAGPSFDQFGAGQRLDRGDARLVEAIHTSSGRMKFSSLFVGGTKRVLEQMLAPLFKRTESSRSISEQFSGEGNHIWFGIDMPVGHIDYHANNGKTQPGCEDHAHICDHGRSHHIYEGFLKHELALRRLHANAYDQDGSQQEHQDEAAAFASWRQDKRLLAVNAVDYSAFASGAALNQRCPALLHERNRLSGLAEQQISHCTLPIDQVTHVDELIGELASNYAVSFSPDEPSNQRYYFKTLSTKPFVGDHYLLRVKLERSTLWDKSCALQAVIEYADEKNTTIELDKELQMFSNGKFFGLTLPFINPNNASARFSLDVMLLKNEELQNHHQLTNNSSGLVLDKSAYEIDEDDEQLIRLILPLSVTLTVVENKSSQSSFSGWIKGQSPGPKCILYIDSVQVHPLASFRRGLFGVYSSRRLSGGSLRTSATMLSHLEYKRRKQAEPVWPDTLTPNTKQNHERRLQTIVVR